MGEVYLAEDTKLDRQVALKFLPKHLTVDKEARERFEREAKAAAALNHPNIVTVYETGDHEGQVFIAMEYVEGQTLKEIISGVGARRDAPSSGDLSLPITHHPLPITQVIDIASQIASGLAAAHAKGIVHRDIKPQNILIDKDHRVKILDFGLAKLKGASPLTKEAFTMGTVHYMSPEQAMGKEVDQRSDIWSFGVVLYEMLTGALPFKSDYDQAVIYAIINEDMAPLPSEKERVPAGIEKIIRCCLAKKHQDRYPTAEALAKALRNLDGAREATKPEKSGGRRFSRRAFLIALTLLLLSGILGFFTLNPRVNTALRRVLGLTGIPRARHMAVLPIIAGGDAEAKALGNGFTAVIIDKLTWLEKFNDSLWTVPADRVFQDRGMSPRALQRLWGCNLFISGDLQAEKNSLRLRLKLQDAMSGRQLRQIELQGNMANLTLFQDGLLSMLLRLIGLPETDATGAYINTGGTSMPGAYILYLKGRGAIQESRNASRVDRGIVYLEKALQQDDRYTLARLALLEAWRYKSRQKKDPGLLQLAESQWPMVRQAAARWAPAQLAWGRLLKENSLKEEARLAFRSALELDSRCYDAQIQLGISRAEAGESTEAESLFKKAIRLRPDYPPAYEELAYFYNMNGRFDEALHIYKKIAELTPGDHRIFNNLGGMHLFRGEKDQAKAMFERSNAIEPNVVAQSNLAFLYFYEGDYQKALPLHLEAAKNSTEHNQWGNLADTYRQLPGEEQKAIAAYRKAIILAEKLLVLTPEDAELISWLASYYAHVGEKQKAMAAIARTRSLAPTFLNGIQRAVLVYEAVNERALALAALREYIERLGDLQFIEREPDLAALRNDPAYTKLVHDTK